MTKIKREIYEDRQNFLQKLISMQSESPSKPASETPKKESSTEKKEDKGEVVKAEIAKKAAIKEDEKSVQSLS